MRIRQANLSTTSTEAIDGSALLVLTSGSSRRDWGRDPKHYLLRLAIALISLQPVAQSAFAGPNLFDEELSKVDQRAKFERVLERHYGKTEWSVDGLTLRGGSPSALDSAASEALYAMGFRYYTPRHSYYPDRLTSVRINKRSNKVPHIRIWLAYGHDRRLETGKKLLNQYGRWSRLSDVADRRWPAGHAWKRVIRHFRSEYQKNPKLLRGPRTFELDDPASYRKNVELSARYIVNHLNEAGRHPFDASDSDRYQSETIFRFSADVVREVRKTVPHAQLGVYAYACHRLPVDFKLPGIYIQVALGFNDSPLKQRLKYLRHCYLDPAEYPKIALGLKRVWYSYQELVERHARVADAIMLREYFDVQAWFHSLPVGNIRNQRHYYEKNYPGYFQSGIKVVNGEFHENWLANIVSVNYAIRFLKEGHADYNAVLSEIVERVFNGDQAVHDLYMLWSTPGGKFNDSILKKSFNIVRRMKSGWHRSAFKQYLVIVYKKWKLGAKGSDGYATRLADLLSNVHALASTGWIHSYAFERRLANGNVRKDLPDLWMFRNKLKPPKPPPAWMTEAKAPTLAEFDEILGRL